ncbi:MAG: VCBS repeat-containing protein [Pirellulaceae bacterium]|nr:VCBS repeat-containing protein [Pirellulaceae bacterium]
MAGNWIVPTRTVPVLLLLGACFSTGCTENAPPPPKQTSLKLDDLLDNKSSANSKDAPVGFQSPIRLRTVADHGIDFVHQSGNSDERPFPAANGSGTGAIDYDLDGRPDLFFANGAQFPIDLNNRHDSDGLYRNLGEFRFQNVATTTGVAYAGFSAGVAAGDFNHDGFPDLYVTCFGENRLYQNQGDGTFIETAARAGVNDKHWGTSAVWFDVDNDGLLDLYVGNYGIWNFQDPDTHKFCHGHEAHIRIFCSPTSVDPAPDFLFLNRGDGTFEDISQSSGVAARMSRTQGVLAADLNNDGWVDLYLGNDMHANSLFINSGQRSFRDDTEASGMGYSSDGKAQAGMGVAAADINHNLDLEVFVTNYMGENNNLYQQVRQGRFGDQSSVQGLAADSLAYVGWGTAFVDLNLDRWNDLVVTNGHTDDNKPNQPYSQLAFVWQNLEGRFRKISTDSGDFLKNTRVGRGLAVVDLDNDGRQDLVCSNVGQAPDLVRNETPDTKAWLLTLEGRSTNRDGVGASVLIESAAGKTLHHVCGGGSYLSQHQLRLTVPFEPGSVKATITWSGDKTSQMTLDPWPTNQELIVRQGN